MRFIEFHQTLRACLISTVAPRLSHAILLAFFCACSVNAQFSIHVPLPVFPRTVVNLTDFGAIGDGATLNTEAFSNAIASLSRKGGGELIVPPGLWLTGPIRLCSNLNLHLERGAFIEFSGDYHLYPLIVVDMKGEKEVDSTSPIFGQGLENVAITGDGIIDGGGNAWRPMKKEKVTEEEWEALVASGGVVNDRGDTWWPSQAAMNGPQLVASLLRQGSLNPADYEPAHQFLRPKMVRLIGCNKVLLQGVTFQNPPNWTLNPALCANVSILNVNVHNSYAAQNSDALDLESCRNAVIRDSIFDAGDDGICLKSGRDAAGRRIGVPDEDVLIDGCTVYHAHGGFVIGSEMSGGMRNIYVNNCTFIGTDNGLRFKSARGRGGIVEHIYISNVRMVNILNNAIGFEMFYQNGGPSAQAAANLPPVNEGTPQFRDIHIDNVICRGAQRAMVLEGLPEMPLRNVELKDVSITAQTGAFVTDARGITFQNVHVECQSGPPLTQTRVTSSSLELAP
ncbi:MAG TPA: glycoside hydrolase family 28 protein [Verrucomicrobiae bacterium]|nr:glycoside hydrolase family 28 protein [Verrucomicrobiae bacterium]